MYDTCVYDIFNVYYFYCDHLHSILKIDALAINSKNISSMVFHNFTQINVIFDGRGIIFINLNS